MIPKVWSGCGKGDGLDFSFLSTSVTVDLAATDSGKEEASSGTSTLNLPSTVVIEYVWGGTGIDFLYGNDSDNRLYGRSSGDSLDGRGGDDMMFGESGDDTVYGGVGTDTVYGDNPKNVSLTGNDYIHVDDLDDGDTVYCGPGQDTVVVDARFDNNVLLELDTHQDCETVNRRLP